MILKMLEAKIKLIIVCIITHRAVDKNSTGRKYGINKIKLLV